MRRRFSVRSFDYDHAPAVSASGRYGLDDALTLEGHAESAPGVYNLGAARWSGWARRAWSALRWPAARAVTRAARPAWATSTCGLSSAWTCCPPGRSAITATWARARRTGGPPDGSRDRVVSHHPVAEHGLELHRLSPAGRAGRQAGLGDLYRQPAQPRGHEPECVPRLQPVRLERRVLEPDADDGRSDPGLRVGQPPAAPGQLQRGRAAFGGL